MPVNWNTACDHSRHGQQARSHLDGVGVQAAGAAHQHQARLLAAQVGGQLALQRAGGAGRAVEAAVDAVEGFGVEELGLRSAALTLGPAAVRRTMKG